MSNRHPLAGVSVLALAATLLLVSACSTVIPRENRMTERAGPLFTSAFAPDGKLIAAGPALNNVVHLYEVPGGRFGRALLGDRDELSLSARAVAFSRDARFVAAAGIDEMVVVWDLTNDSIVLRLPDFGGAAALAFSPADDTLAVSGPGNDVTLLRVPEGEPIGRLSAHSAPVLSVAFSADGTTLATGSADRTARLWSVAELRQLRAFDGYDHPVHAVSFSPDGSTLATYAGNVQLWQGGEGPAQPLALPGQKSSAGTTASVAMSLLSLIASARSIQLGGGPIGSPVVTVPSDVSVAVTRRLPVIFSPDGKTIAILRHKITFGGDYEILVHDLATRTTKSTNCQCFSISFSPDGTMLAVVGQSLGGESPSGGKLRLLDVSTFSWL